jgi:hypothetical protein
MAGSGSGCSVMGRPLYRSKSAPALFQGSNPSFKECPKSSDRSLIGGSGRRNTVSSPVDPSLKMGGGGGGLKTETAGINVFVKRLANNTLQPRGEIATKSSVLGPDVNAAVKELSDRTMKFRCDAGDGREFTGEGIANRIGVTLSDMVGQMETTLIMKYERLEDEMLRTFSPEKKQEILKNLVDATMFAVLLGAKGRGISTLTKGKSETKGEDESLEERKSQVYEIFTLVQALYIYDDSAEGSSSDYLDRLSQETMDFIELNDGEIESKKIEFNTLIKESELSESEKKKTSQIFMANLLFRDALRSVSNSNDSNGLRKYLDEFSKYVGYLKDETALLEKLKAWKQGYESSVKLAGEDQRALDYNKKMAEAELKAMQADIFEARSGLSAVSLLYAFLSENPILFRDDVPIILGLLVGIDNDKQSYYKEMYEQDGLSTTIYPLDFVDIKYAENMKKLTSKLENIAQTERRCSKKSLDRVDVSNTKFKNEIDNMEAFILSNLLWAGNGTLGDGTDYPIATRYSVADFKAEHSHLSDDPRTLNDEKRREIFDSLYKIPLLVMNDFNSLRTRLGFPEKTLPITVEKASH